MGFTLPLEPQYDNNFVHYGYTLDYFVTWVLGILLCEFESGSLILCGGSGEFKDGTVEGDRGACNIQ